jgi:all-trans-retinol 13,14-reductase
MPRFTATWTAKTQIAPNVYEIVLETNEPFPQYIPGQYINIEFESRKYRSYSIVKLDRMLDKTRIILIVDILANGLASEYFTNHTPPLDLDNIGPTGRFGFIPSPRKKVFVATGTGIAPIIPIITSLLAHQDTNFELIFGVKTIEHNYVSRYLASVKPILCVSQEVGTNGEFKGRVTDYFTLHKSEYTDADFYLCGNPNMVTQMTSLIAADYPDAQIVTEKFLLKP